MQMILEHEVITLLLSIAALIFFVHDRARLSALPSSGLLLAAFSVLLAGRVLTVLEGFWLTELMNLLEHLCYAASALLLAGWCRRAFARDGGEA